MHRWPQGIHFSGKRLRCDWAITPKDKGCWKNNDVCFIVECKGSSTHDKKHLAQCIDYVHSTWDMSQCGINFPKTNDYLYVLAWPSLTIGGDFEWDHQNCRFNERLTKDRKYNDLIRFAGQLGVGTIETQEKWNRCSEGPSKESSLSLCINGHPVWSESGYKRYLEGRVHVTLMEGTRWNLKRKFGSR